MTELMKHKEFDITELIEDIKKAEFLCVEIGVSVKIWYVVDSLVMSDEGNWYLLIFEKNGNKVANHMELLFSPFDIDADVVLEEAMSTLSCPVWCNEYNTEIVPENIRFEFMWAVENEDYSYAPSHEIGALQKDRYANYSMKLIHVLDRQDIKFRLFNRK